jgi:hypothetical protein
MHPDKTIGMAMRGAVILKDLSGAHPIAEKQLQELGVQIHYNSEIGVDQKFKANETDDYECYIDCRGFKYEGPAQYMQNDLQQCLDKKSNQILVDAKGKVTSVHPISEHKKTEGEAIMLKNVFSFGDVCLTPANEIKSIVSMYQYCHVIAGNMLSVTREECPTLTIPKEFHTIQMIPVGSKKGIFAFNNMVKAEPNAWIEKCKIRDMQIGALNQEPKWVKEANKNRTVMPKLFGCASGCCFCVPIHISKNKKFSTEKFGKSKASYDEFY